MATAEHPDEAAALRAGLVRALLDAGLLADPAWRAAFAEVPRHLFVPRFFLPDQQGGWHAVARGDPGWLPRVYTDEVLVTQLDDDPDRWATARADGPVPGVPTSSSSQPAIMAVMLTALGVDDGMRVLEIGTGTGYNAALLCHRLGAAAVSTVDVDPALVDAARDGLAAAGHHPDCVIADGADGYPAGAPYDRILATCSVSTIPPAWLAQLRPGGAVVTTLNRPLGAGLLRITATGDGHGQGRVLAEDGRFMSLRADRVAPVALPDRTAPAAQARRSRLRSISRRFEFFAGLALPGVLAVADDAGGYWLLHPDGSSARCGQHGRVTQAGLRPLWDELESAHRTWQSLGSPPRESFTVTITPAGGHFALPGHPETWPL